MDDAISKQQAIDAIGEKSDEIYKTKQKGATYPHDDFFQGMAYAENVVKQLPPIQPKRGKWIEIEAFDDSRYVKCDQCKTVQVFYYGKRNTNFCPNCGADMREVNNESN